MASSTTRSQCRQRRPCCRVRSLRRCKWTDLEVQGSARLYLAARRIDSERRRVRPNQSVCQRVARRPSVAVTAVPTFIPAAVFSATLRVVVALENTGWCVGRISVVGHCGWSAPLRRCLGLPGPAACCLWSAPCRSRSPCCHWPPQSKRQCDPGPAHGDATRRDPRSAGNHHRVSGRRRNGVRLQRLAVDQLQGRPVHIRRE